MKVEFRSVSDNITNAYSEDLKLRGVMAFRPDSKVYEVSMPDMWKSGEWKTFKSQKEAEKYIQENASE